MSVCLIMCLTAGVAFLTLRTANRVVPGGFAITPSGGIGGITIFSLSASSWQTDNPPLVFYFATETAINASNPAAKLLAPLTSPSLVAAAQMRLLPGSNTLYAIAVDAAGESAMVSLSFTLTVPNATSVQQLTGDAAQALASGVDDV